MGVREQLLEQGYFQTPPMLPPDLVARVRDDVARDNQRAFLEDAMWDLFDLLVPVAREALAHDVCITPAFWAWNVGPGGFGWGPHRDSPETARDPEGGLAIITVWVPLTDATTRNGCVHCVPAYWDIGYQSVHANSIVLHQQCVRALPAAAGSVLGWSHSLLHWGGACAPDAPPRMATSLELVRSDLASTVPRAYPAGWRPEVAERQAMIEAMRVRYAHMLAD